MCEWGNPEIYLRDTPDDFEDKINGNYKLSDTINRLTMHIARHSKCKFHGCGGKLPIPSLWGINLNLWLLKQQFYYLFNTTIPS